MLRVINPCWGGRFSTLKLCQLSKCRLSRQWLRTIINRWRSTEIVRATQYAASHMDRWHPKAIFKRGDRPTPPFVLSPFVSESFNSVNVQTTCAPVSLHPNHASGERSTSPNSKVGQPIQMGHVCMWNRPKLFITAISLTQNGPSEEWIVKTLKASYS